MTIQLILWARLQFLCLYHIENMQQYVNDSGEFVLPESLITMFNSISISTGRGVLFTLFRGTFLHSVILPIVNPQQVTTQLP